MKQLVAYALRADLEGDVEVYPEEGKVETVRKFGGGVLWVGDGDFHVRDSLDAGDGTIVVRDYDQVLVDLLDAYPALKRVAVPASPAAIVSPYDRRETEDLRHLASLRDIDGSISRASRASLISALETQDAAIHDGDQARVDAASVADDGEGDASAASTGDTSFEDLGDGYEGNGETGEGD